MKALTVLYDPTCAFCRRSVGWLSGQPAFLHLSFVPNNAPDLEARFEGVSKLGPFDDVVVIGDDGAVYRGPDAFIMCLYALRQYREWALRLARPALLPFARRAFELLSENRASLSRLLHWGGDKELGGLFEHDRGCRPGAAATCRQGG